MASRFVDPSTPIEISGGEYTNALATPITSTGGMGSASHTGMTSPLQREGSLILGPGVGADFEDSHRTIDLSNGIRIQFINRRGWPAECVGGSDIHDPKTTPQRGHGGSGLSGQRVTPFADVVLSYQLLKAIDKKAEELAKGQRDAAIRRNVIAKAYTQFNFASNEPLANRMQVGDVYEEQRDFEITYVPSYGDCSAPAFYALNLAFPYLREGDEVILFAPSYLGPSLQSSSLGEDFRPIRTFDEASQSYIDPPSAPSDNSEYAEHSFVRLAIQKVRVEEVLREDRYITKKVIYEGKGSGGVGGDHNRRLDLGDGDSNSDGDNPTSLPRQISRQRRVGVGSVVCMDIGEVNEFLGKPCYFRNVKGLTVGTASTCEELDVVLLSMAEGEYSLVKIGSVRYHIKLLEIAEGTARGEVVGDAATELARLLKDTGNSVLAAGASAVTRQFASPTKPPKTTVTMGSPQGITSPTDATRGHFDDSLSLEALLAKRYFSPPADLTCVPVLDALSTFVVRPLRNTYLRCIRNPTTTAASQETYAERVNNEATCRALQLYRYAERVLLDRDGEYYDGGASSSPSHSPPRSSSERKSASKSASLSLVERKSNYDVGKRIELLGTIFGNCAQVYLNLKFYDEAAHAATEAIERCAPQDSFKHFYRRSLAFKFKGLYREALDDLYKVKVMFQQQGIRDERVAEMEREMASVISLLQSAN